MFHSSCTDHKCTEWEEIVENDYDLSINKYKEIEYEEIVYEKPEVIIGKIKELEKEITLGLEELEKLVK